MMTAYLYVLRQRAGIRRLSATTGFGTTLC